MWQVVATGTKGSTFVYEVDGPDDASKAEVFNVACLQHARERQNRHMDETLDIREGAYGIRLLYPQGHRELLDAVIEKAAKADLTLTAEDVEWDGTDAIIDGMSARAWFETLGT